MTISVKLDKTKEKRGTRVMPAPKRERGSLHYKRRNQDNVEALAAGGSEQRWAPELKFKGKTKVTWEHFDGVIMKATSMSEGGMAK